jgi:hypothetical protein
MTPTRGLFAVLAASATVGVALPAVAASPAALAAPATSRASSAMRPAQTTNGFLLRGVSAVSAKDVWAVGYYWAPANQAHTVILNWNGTAWSQVASPDPGTASNWLDAVTAVSADDVWAVGSSENTTTGDYSTLIVHWNGTAWSQVPSPNPSTPQNGLTGVSAASASDVWAVGGRGGLERTGGKQRTLTEHWNGTAWSRVPSPNPSPPQAEGNSLNAVTAVSPTDAWAVGWEGSGNPNVDNTSMILHWNGTAWSQVASPPPAGAGANALTGVSAVKGKAAAFAVGEAVVSEKATPNVLRWNSSQWRQQAVPEPGSVGNSLSAVSMLSASDAWAVGDYSKPGMVLPMYPLAMYWDGTAWSVTKTPGLGDQSELNAVTTVSATDAWAVGASLVGDSINGVTLILHWNGKTWTKSPPPGIPG